MTGKRSRRQVKPGFQARSSLLVRSILVFMLTISIPVIFMEMLTLRHWTNQTGNMVSETFENRLRDAVGTLQDSLVLLETLNDSFYEEATYSPFIIDRLGRPDGKARLRDDTSVFSFFEQVGNRVFAQYRGETTFSFFTTEGELLFQSASDPERLPYGGSLRGYADAEWFRGITAKPEGNSVIAGHRSFYNPSDSRLYLSFAQVIRSTADLTHLGVSVLTIPMDAFDRIWNEPEGGDLFAVRAYAGDRLVYANSDESEPVDQADLVLTAPLSPYDIRIDAYFSRDALIQPYLASLVRSNVYIIGFTLVCLLLFVVYLTYKLRPVYLLAHKMSKARDGDFKVKMTHESQGELGLLVRTFNEMTGEIDRLFRMKEQEHDEKIRMLKQALESRINPHFLYNTLDLIQYRVMEREREHVSEMIVSLSRLLRYTTENPGAKVSVREELHMLQQYLWLQGELFGEEVETVLDIDERALEEPLDKLILQPLVENCFEHAFIRRERRYRLDIRVALEDGRLAVGIRDNGAGFPAQLSLALSPERLVPENLPFAGSGLKITLQRFLLAESTSEITLESSPGLGTAITLYQRLQKCATDGQE